MDIQQDNSDKLNAVLTIKISNTDYNEQYEKALKSYKKQVQMPG